MDNVVGLAPTVRDKYPEKEQQNGQFSGENDGVVNYLNHVGQLCHMPESVMTNMSLPSSIFSRRSPAPIRPGLFA